MKVTSTSKSSKNIILRSIFQMKGVFLPRPFRLYLPASVRAFFGFFLSARSQNANFSHLLPLEAHHSPRWCWPQGKDDYSEYPKTQQFKTVLPVSVIATSLLQGVSGFVVFLTPPLSQSSLPVWMHFCQHFCIFAKTGELAKMFQSDIAGL